MTRCPKCSGTRIYGPRYQKGPYGGEYLSFECAKCGYRQTTPTDDALFIEGAISDAYASGWRPKGFGGTE